MVLVRDITTVMFDLDNNYSSSLSKTKIELYFLDALSTTIWHYKIGVKFDTQAVALHPGLPPYTAIRNGFGSAMIPLERH